jgi:hypothetical protein
MKTDTWFAFGLAGIAALTVAAFADGVGSETLRTTAYFLGAAQRPYTQLPAIDYPPVAGNNLVNLAMGRNVSDTNFPNQVLALTFPCDLSAANLVVYDRTASNLVGTVASSTSIDRVYDVQLVKVRGATAKTNEVARFVAFLPILAGGTATNGLLGGYLTIAGRLQINPISGCPTNIPVASNKDSYDRGYALKEVPNKNDKDAVKLSARTGLANIMGAIDLVSGGLTNTVLIPLGNLSIRYFLPLTAN